MNCQLYTVKTVFPTDPRVLDINYDVTKIKYITFLEWLIFYKLTTIQNMSKMFLSTYLLLSKPEYIKWIGCII